jgi:hypothetical protein
METEQSLLQPLKDDPVVTCYSLLRGDYVNCKCLLLLARVEGKLLIGNQRCRLLPI